MLIKPDNYHAFCETVADGTVKNYVSRFLLDTVCGLQQYYLEKNLDARERELEREAELEEKAPKLKAKSKMSKVQSVSNV